MVCSLVVYDHITDRKVLGGVGPASSVGTSLARWTWRSAEMHIRKSAFTTTSSTTTTTPDFIEDTIRYCCCCSTTKLMVARMKKHVTHTRYSNSSKSQYDWKKSGKLMALPSLLPGHEPKVWAKSVLSKTSVKEPKKGVDREDEEMVGDLMMKLLLWLFPLSVLYFLQYVGSESSKSCLWEKSSQGQEESSTLGIWDSFLVNFNRCDYCWVWW